MELAKISTRILYDVFPENYSDKDTIVYCFAHNNTNLPLIANTLSVFNKNIPKYILENKVFMSGVSKSDEVKDFYSKYNIQTFTIPYDNDWINTKIESNSVLNWLIKQKKFKNIIICAPVFHIVRAYMTMVSSLIDLNKESTINIYSLPAKIENWHDITITHQGKNKNSFNNFIQIELDRINEYTKKGDIKNSEIIWDYMMNRC